MTTGLIIFARMSSTRFPGKMLHPVAGRALLGRVIDRVRLVGGDHQIVVATSDHGSDDAIERFAEMEDTVVFRGSLDDVGARAMACCQAYGFDRFARICGDRPFLPWELICDLLEMHASQDLDLATNAQTKSYPAGTMTEIVATEALERVLYASSDPGDREHVTRYMYKHPSRFKIGSRESGQPGWTQLRLSIDQQEDVERIEWIMEQLGAKPETARLEEMVALVPDWYASKKAKEV